MRGAALRAGIALALTIAGCGDRDDPGAAPRTRLEQNQRIETNWQEWMSRPPKGAEPADAPPLSADASREMETLVRAGWNGLDALIDAARKHGDSGVQWLEQFVSQDKDPTARALAVFAIGKAGRPRAAAMLCRALRDSDPEVSALAMRALGDLRVPWTLTRIAKDVGRYDANKLLVVRVLACSASLAFANYSGVPVLLRILKEHTPLEDTAGRDWAKQQRMALEKEEAIDAIRRLAGDDFGFDANAPPARQAESIHKIEAWWMTNRKRLWDSSPPIADPALRARVDELIEAFDDYQISMVDNARYILAWLGPRVFPLLAPHLSDPRNYVRVHLLETLENLADEFGSEMPDVVRAIVPLARDPQPAVRRAAVGALGALGRPELAAPLLAHVTDPDPSVRVAVLRALGQLGTPEAVRALETRAAAADHGDEWVTAHAALARLGHTASRNVLLQELMSEDVTQQSRALDALGILGVAVAKFPLGGATADRARVRDEFAAMLRTE